jgi:hypothetical protein
LPRQSSRKTIIVAALTSGLTYPGLQRQRHIKRARLSLRLSLEFFARLVCLKPLAV